VKQVRVHGPGDARVDDVPEPDPGPRDAVVRVATCGLCGSDVSYVRMGGLAGPGREPMCLGHEVAGVVDWVGAEVRHTRPGDRVVVHPGTDELGRIGNGAPQGGLTPLLLVTEADRERLHHVPDTLPLDVAAFAEPLAVGMHAAEQAEVRDSEGVGVFGCGPIGLAAIASLVDRGNRQVVGVDPSAARRRLALDLGAQAALDPADTDVWDALTALHGKGSFALGPTPATGAFIEASGSGRVIADIVEHAPPGARVSVVALHFEPVPTSFLAVMMKQLTLRGSMEYPARFADSVDLLARRDLAGLVTDRYPLARFPEALARLQGSKDCGKVMVTIDDTLR
jgi:(R,R)-butanediol dehydrogenase / meso-butanediol dehydrogenase / diacetyl reductase